MTGLEISEEKKKAIIQKFKEYYLEYGLSIYILSVDKHTINFEISQRSDAKDLSTKDNLQAKILELFDNTPYTVVLEWLE